MLQPEEIGKYLDVQHGTSLLDNFVHKIIVKCNSEVRIVFYRLYCFNSNLEA